MEEEKGVKLRSRVIATFQIREKLRQILALKDSPQRIAFSFATGVFIGMSPLLGIHTLLGLAVAWQFRLNKFVTLLGVYVTNPWTIIPIYSFGTWLGAKLIGLERVLPEIDWSTITFWELVGKCRFLLKPFVIGSTLLGLVSALVSYYLIHAAVKRARA